MGAVRLLQKAILFCIFAHVFNDSKLMKITKVKEKNGTMQKPVSTELSAVVEQMRSKKTLDMREKPRLLFSATFGRGGFDEVRSMTGLLLMTAVAGTEQQAREWQRAVMQVPYTLLAFRNVFSKELNVVVRVAFADGHEPAEVGEYLSLLQQAQSQVAPVYQSLTGCRLRRCEVSLDSGCSLCYDPHVGYHAEAQSFPVIVKDSSPLTKYQDVKVETDGSIEWYPSYEEREQLRMEYYSCLYRALEEHPDDNDEEQALVALADYCRKARLEEEACVKRTLWQCRFQGQEDLVRKIFRSAYVRSYQGKTTSQMNQKERIARTIRDFFERRYQLRYNMVKQVTEFRPNDQQFRPWQPLTDRDLKRIAFEEMLEGGHGWMVDIELYVGSSLVPRYNPIHEFLGGVGQWDRQHDYIEEYARRLKTDYADWPRYFHRWLLAMVAQAMEKSRDHGNSMVPLLIGTQAMKKSTWCKNILPYQLREYYMDDIKMDNAEQVERVLSRMWLVNIDEYNAKTDREQAKIKRLLTEKDVQVRKMRSDQYTMMPRLCSFIATTNDRQPLCDPTGSRRYLCVEVTGVADMTGKVNYKQMYAQVVWEIEHGVQYWFSDDDERAITEHNQRYQLHTSIEEVLMAFYEPVSRDKEHFLTTTAIQQQLRRHLQAADVPTLAKLGRVLRHMHYPEGAQNGIRGYYLSPRHPA